MGKIIQIAKIENSFDVLSSKKTKTEAVIRTREIEFLVDTGAAMLCLPIDTIEELGLDYLQTRQVMTANGVVSRRIYSSVKITIFDREATMDVMELPPGTPPLMGYLVLETLDLYPDAVRQTLTGNPKYDGKMIMDLL